MKIPEIRGCTRQTYEISSSFWAKRIWKSGIIASCIGENQNNYKLCDEQQHQYRHKCNHVYKYLGYELKLGREPDPWDAKKNRSNLDSCWMKRIMLRISLRNQILNEQRKFITRYNNTASNWILAVDTNGWLMVILMFMMY